MIGHLSEKLPRPEEMKPDAYQRNIAARAFDVARYVLFFGIPTGVGQVTSIRTLERQIRRLKASEYAEVREIAGEIAEACSAPPACAWDESAGLSRLLLRSPAMSIRMSTRPSRGGIWNSGPARIFHLQRGATEWSA